MGKKKILFMINSMGLGGAEKSLLSLLSLLNYDKYDVDLQMISFGGMFESLLPKEVNVLPLLDYVAFCKLPLKKQILSLNFKFLFARIKTMLSLRKNKKHGRPLHDTQAYWQGCKNAFGRHPCSYDVAIAWGQGTPTHYVATKVSAERKYSWINADYESAGHNRDFDRDFYAVFDRNICVSNELAKLFEAVFPEYAEKTDVILDIQNSKLIQKMSEEPITLPKTAEVTIVTVGRYVEPKNYPLAIDTAYELKKRGLDFVWYAVGEGAERPNLEEKIKERGLEENFILLGAKSNPYPYIKASDVYVQTSSFEGYCLTLAEARMLNKPCAATKFDVVFEQMVQRKNGIVVEMKPEAVAGAITELIENDKLRKHIIDYLKNEKKGNEEELEKVEALLDGEQKRLFC